MWLSDAVQSRQGTHLFIGANRPTLGAVAEMS